MHDLQFYSNILLVGLVDIHCCTVYFFHLFHFMKVVKMKEERTVDFMKNETFIEKCEIILNISIFNYKPRWFSLAHITKIVKTILIV